MQGPTYDERIDEFRNRLKKEPRWLETGFHFLIKGCVHPDIWWSKKMEREMLGSGEPLCTAQVVHNSDPDYYKFIDWTENHGIRIQ